MMIDQSLMTEQHVIRDEALIKDQSLIRDQHITKDQCFMRDQHLMRNMPLMRDQPLVVEQSSIRDKSIITDQTLVRKNSVRNINISMKETPVFREQTLSKQRCITKTQSGVRDVFVRGNQCSIGEASSLREEIMVEKHSSNKGMVSHKSDPAISNVSSAPTINSAAPDLRNSNQYVNNGINFLPGTSVKSRDIKPCTISASDNLNMKLSDITISSTPRHNPVCKPIFMNKTIISSGKSRHNHPPIKSLTDNFYNLNHVSNSSAINHRFSDSMKATDDEGDQKDTAELP